MKTKTCSKCKKVKPVKAFPRGYRGRPHSWCKKCHAAGAKNWRMKNREKLAAYQRTVLRNERAKRLKFIREAIAKDWRVMFLHKLAFGGGFSRTQCYTITNKLVKLGLIPVTDFCERCGADSFLQLHHPDYRNPANVQVLCRSCHKKEDGKAIE